MTRLFLKVRTYNLFADELSHIMKCNKCIKVHCPSSNYFSYVRLVGFKWDEFLKISCCSTYNYDLVNNVMDTNSSLHSRGIVVSALRGR